MKICVVSEENFLSRFIEENSKDTGNVVERVNTGRPDHVSSLLPDFDYVVLNHRTTLNRRIIENLDDTTKIIDFSLAKTPMLRYRNRIVSLALLNDVSENISEPRYELVVIGDVSAKNAPEIASRIFPGVATVSRTAEEHDRIMSEILVKPYVMSLLARKITDLDQAPRTGEYEMVLELSRYVTNYNVDHIRDLMRNNPFTSEVFSKVEENLKRVWNELSLY